ncbi:MAG: NAD(P)-dependent oxidoreductase [Deltaproteobacteria bacterium]|nr:NAD(P)-dependent oxidoreductase [Deltaproteobacteria bacterium]
MKVAFLGLGTMGAPMALNVLRSGHPLTVWNRTASKAQELERAGAKAATSPQEAARSAEVVITMLADVAAVQDVIAGPHGVVRCLSPGTVVVDMSTVDPDTARRMSHVVGEAGAAFVDAPVSGTRKPAVDGTLVIMAGGPIEAIERVRPVLEAMGRVRVVGGVGQGMAMKLVLNCVGAHMLAGFTSALVMGRMLGLRPRDMLETIQAGAFCSPMYGAKGERILRGSFEPDFTIELLRKDQKLVAQTAGSVGASMPTHDSLVRVLDEAIEAGFGSLDLCGLIRWFESRAGCEVRDESAPNP